MSFRMFSKRIASDIALIVLVALNLINVVISDQPTEAEKFSKYEESTMLAQSIAVTFVTLFDGCVETTMSNNQFSVDNLQSFIVYPGRTTIGLMPKFTTNRKFFANMLTTTAFKEMLAKDEDEIRKNLIRKMKYCDEATMDQNLLKDFYDREVDQSKL